MTKTHVSLECIAVNKSCNRFGGGNVCDIIIETYSCSYIILEFNKFNKFQIFQLTIVKHCITPKSKQNVYLFILKCCIMLILYLLIIHIVFEVVPSFQEKCGEVAHPEQAVLNREDIHFIIWWCYKCHYL